MSDTDKVAVTTEFTITAAELLDRAKAETAAGMEGIFAKAREDQKQIKEAVPGATVTGSVKIGRTRYEL